MIYIIIAILVLVSILWSLWTLLGILKNAKIVKGVKKELSHNRVVFHKDHIQSSSDSPSVSDVSSESGLGA